MGLMSDRPLILQNREQHGVADVAVPGDAVGAEQAFAHGAELLHRRLRARVAAVDVELDAADARGEGAGEHHVLDAAVETGAAEFRSIISPADLEHLARFVDAEKARHAGELVAVEQHERAGARVGDVAIDRGIEAVGAEIAGVNLPNLAVFGAGGLQWLAMPLTEQFAAAAVAG